MCVCEEDEQRVWQIKSDSIRVVNLPFVTIVNHRKYGARKSGRQWLGTHSVTECVAKFATHQRPATDQVKKRT